MEFEFRPVRQEEMRELVKLLELVFGDGERWFLNIITQDPWRERGRAYVAAADGRLIANVQVHCRPIRYGRARLVMGGIGHVATHPDFRRQGLAGRLLTDQLAYMRASGYHLSQLYTGINPYYESYGWRTLPFASRRLWLESWSPSGGDAGYDLRAVAVPEDLPTLAPVYDACADHWVGALDRTDAYWKANPSWTLGEFLGEDSAACHVAERGGRLCGYLRGRTEGLASDRASLGELCWLPGEEACVVPLLEDFLSSAREAGKRFVDLAIGEAHPAYEALGGVDALDALPDGSTMFRVIDVAGLLHAAGPELSRRLAAAGRSELRPLTLDAEIGGARLEARPDWRVTEHEGPADLTITQAAFLRLFLGRESAESLEAKNELDWTGPDRTEELAVLFPPRPYYYCRYDKF